MGECYAFNSLQDDLKVKCAAWVSYWRPPGADRLSLRGHTESKLSRTASRRRW